MQTKQFESKQRHLQSARDNTVSTARVWPAVEAEVGKWHTSEDIVVITDQNTYCRVAVSIDWVGRCATAIVAGWVQTERWGKNRLRVCRQSAYFRGECDMSRCVSLQPWLDLWDAWFIRDKVVLTADSAGVATFVQHAGAMCTFFTRSAGQASLREDQDTE